uniref:RepN n=1 Tax=Thermoanaerobacterium thermosaccharolyticum TaxID=1517 RepID=Q52234_THETR|nr:protein rep [Thermoanaerobacterium thermosaccharolyticum]AAD12628.1 RepN [Thermoanaerobacterium thermosaccharolyticum]prf//1906306A ORF 1 in plasmid pNB2 [Thermoanaerobacterium thermosaccharolyticum]
MKWAKFKNLKERQKVINDKFLSLSNSFKDDFYRKIFFYEYVKLNSCSYYVVSATCERCNTRHFVGFSRCKSRFCLVCNTVRTVKYIKKVLEVSNLDVNNYFHCVLTLKNYDDLDKMLDDINMFWRDFYNGDRTFRVNFKQRFIGGLRSTEIKRGKNLKWHVHLHLLLITSKEFRRDFDFLKDRWKKVTDGLGSVFIKQAKDYDVVVEVIKYITNLEKISLDDLQDIYLSVKNRRLVSSLGILRGVDKKVESEMDSVVDDDINFICKVCGYNKYKFETLLYGDVDYMCDL